ncbi:hypothetical protein BVX99_02220, partial [bacterium F16]
AANATPAQPAANATPAQPAANATPAQPAANATPAQPAANATPAQPAANATPAQPAANATPAQPATNATPAQPATNATPAQPATNATPAQLITAPEVDAAQDVSKPIVVTPKNRSSKGVSQTATSIDDSISTIAMDRRALNIEGYGEDTEKNSKEKPSKPAVDDEVLKELSKKPISGWPEPLGASATDEGLPQSKNTGWPSEEIPDLTKSGTPEKKTGINEPVEVDGTTDTHKALDAPAQFTAEKTHIIDKNSISKKAPPAPSFFKQPPVPVGDKVTMNRYEAETTSTQESSEAPKARIIENLGGSKAQLNEARARKAFADNQAQQPTPPKTGNAAQDFETTGTINLPRGTHALKTIGKLAQKNLQNTAKKPVQAIGISDTDASKQSGIKDAGALKSPVAQPRPSANLDDLVRMIREQLPQLQANSGSRITMDFTSSRFGDLNISLTQQQGRLSVVIQADSDSSQESLSQNRNELNRQLRQMGYGQVNVEINNSSRDEQAQSEDTEDNATPDKNIRFIDENGDILEDYTADND